MRSPHGTPAGSDIMPWTRALLGTRYLTRRNACVAVSSVKGGLSVLVITHVDGAVVASRIYVMAGGPRRVWQIVGVVEPQVAPMRRRQTLAEFCSSY